MKRIVLNVLLVTTVLVSDAGAQAPDSTEAIKPFVNEFTIAASRVDLGAINFDALDRWSEQVLDAARFDKDERTEVEGELKQTLTEARQWAAGIRKAGGSTIWVVFSIESLPDAPIFMIVPTGRGVDAQQIQTLLAQIAPGGPDHAEILKTDNALIIPGGRGGLKWIKSIKPAPRPELVAALSAAGDGALQLALIPSADARKVVESLTPTLPDNQSASVLARGIVWASLTLQAPPNVAGHVVIQSPDQQSAADLMRSLKALANWARRAESDPKTKRMVGSVAALIDQLQVRKDRVELTVDAKQSIAVAGEISRGLHVSRQAAARRQSAGNIKQLLLGCIMYANVAKGNAFPDSLQQMIQQQEIAPQVALNPNRPTEKPGYIYVKPPEPMSKVPADRLVIYENFKDFDGGVTVGFGDGHVEFINNQAEFQKMLDEAQQKQKQVHGNQ